ncbi:hypothetical protein [Salinimicrobium xinjiangense]|uniref:hypothetical protein n=1 Tax=Salinimicrobium xinjiangense TaxID=438596 RepID=UPI0004268CE6|nr:hypothetical protein [Salinimicrobium xinjiangense]
MREILTFFTILIFSFDQVKSQELSHMLAPEGFETRAHQERVYVHHNSAVIFPGEYFLYSVYNLNSKTGKLSDLSKIAYVELIGENSEVVFRQKVMLEGGRGYADYFIPTSVPSGNYKLVAYTNWMRNLEDNYFESDIVLINPYQSNQKQLLKTGINTNSEVHLKGRERTENAPAEGLLPLSLNKNTFKKRDQVKINTGNTSGEVMNGTYSLSVRKLETLSFNPKKTANSNGSKNEELFIAKENKLKLPELRGQIVAGRLTSGANITPGKRIVALSIPSEEGFTNLVETNKEGQFFFNVETDIRNRNAVLEIIGSGGDEFKIELDRQEGIDPSGLQFSEFTLTPEMEDIILQRSIYNQIENAFFSVKPDTLVPPEKESGLPEKMMETYQLSDYTRFKSVPETFVEIIKSAGVRKNAEGQAVFQVRGLNNYVEMGLLPLVMIDGIMVQDHSIPAGMDARRLKSVKIIRDKIFLGPASFQGAVIFETLDNDYFDEHSAPNVRKVELFTSEVPKKYFQQVYTEKNRNNRVPDFRYQLYWNPNLDLKSSGEAIEFFTSDVEGDFEVVLEGFTAEGKPVSLREYFRVE